MVAFLSPTGLLNERLLSTAQVAQMFPALRGTRKTLDESTVRRWITMGVVVRRSGRRRVKLDAIRVGGTYRTSQEAIERFQAELNRTSEPAEEITVRTPRQAKRAAEAAMERMRQRGAKID